MAIEIKELRIRITVSEPGDNPIGTAKLSPLKMKELKEEIVHECTRKVFEKIKEKSER